ncbi:MAG TPA: hypothetical protein VK158_06710 [Acidobacteriota bacterium]|nr:hypothetical protein [Acidobacteriota bacterium]
MIRSRNKLLQELVRLYDAEKKLTWNSIAKEKDVASALARRNTSGKKLFESINDAREAVAYIFEQNGRNTDARRLRATNNQTLQPWLKKPLAPEELDRRRADFMAEIQRRHQQGLPISFEYYKQHDYSKLSKMRRAFGTYRAMLQKAGISEADAYEKLTLPLEAHICMMYDFYLQGNNPSLRNVLDNMPGAAAKILNTFDRSYETGLSLIERLLREHGLHEDANGFNPKAVKQRSYQEQSEKRKNSFQTSKAKMYIFRKEETYDERALPAEFKCRFNQPPTGHQILTAVRHSGNWLYSVEFAKMVGGTPQSIMPIAKRLMPQKMIRVQMNSEAHYFLAKECVKEFIQYQNGVTNGSPTNGHVESERKKLLHERYLAQVASSLRYTPKIKNL